MEAGGFFRAGRGLRIGAQTAVSATRQAVLQQPAGAVYGSLEKLLVLNTILGTFDDIVKNLKTLR